LAGSVVDSDQLSPKRTGDQDTPAQGQVVGSASSREKAVEANPDEASREHVQAQPTEEFVGADGHDPDLTAVGVVLPAKRDAVVGDVDEPMIGNRDAVRVTREVVQHVTPPKGGLA
jgi:hypothetical protein